MTRPQLPCPAGCEARLACMPLNPTTLLPAPPPPQRGELRLPAQPGAVHPQVGAVRSSSLLLEHAAFV